MGGGDLDLKKSAAMEGGERERNSGSWFVSVSAAQRAYSTRLLTRTHMLTRTHTQSDERTIYLGQQSVCWVQRRAAGSSLTDILTTQTKT